MSERNQFQELIGAFLAINYACDANPTEENKQEKMKRFAEVLNYVATLEHKLKRVREIVEAE